jgi:hypothetical protein
MGLCRRRQGQQGGAIFACDDEELVSGPDDRACCVVLGRHDEMLRCAPVRLGDSWQCRPTVRTAALARQLVSARRHGYERCGRASAPTAVGGISWARRHALEGREYRCVGHVSSDGRGGNLLQPARLWEDVAPCLEVCGSGEHFGGIDVYDSVNARRYQITPAARRPPGAAPPARAAGGCRRPPRQRARASDRGAGSGRAAARTPRRR